MKLEGWSQLSQTTSNFDGVIEMYKQGFKLQKNDYKKEYKKLVRILRKYDVNNSDELKEICNKAEKMFRENNDTYTDEHRRTVRLKIADIKKDIEIIENCNYELDKIRRSCMFKDLALSKYDINIILKRYEQEVERELRR